MNQFELVNVLEDKFIKDTYKIRRILIDGKWGIGKTYCWETFIALVEKVNNNVDEKIKPIKVSLFGVNSIEALDRKLKIKIAEAMGDSFFEGNKITQAIQKGVQQVFNAANKKFAGGSVDPLVFINVTNKHIICFDDLERKSEKLKITDVLGYIDEIAQIARVLIIANEENIASNEKKDYRDYKEKIIDAEYHLNEIADDICETLLAEMNLKKEFKKIIIDMFKKFGNGNLRTLNKVKFLVGNFSNQVENMNDNLVKMCVAVVINEYSPEKQESHSTESKDRKVNPLLVYRKFDIHSGAIALENEIISYLKENKFDIAKVNRYLNPNESEISILENLLMDIHLFNENKLMSTMQKAISFINDLKGPYFLESLLRIVGYVLKYNALYDLKLSEQEINLLKEHTYQIIKSLISSKSDMKELQQIKMKVEQNGGIFGINDLLPYLTDVIGRTKEIISEEVRHWHVEFIDKLFENGDYYECFEKLVYEKELITSRLHFYDGLIDNPSQEYFSSISKFTWHIREDQLRSIIGNYLDQIKQDITDKVILKRFELVHNDLME